jgi:predicted metal-dependent phosphoesterase TrpH
MNNLTLPLLLICGTIFSIISWTCGSFMRADLHIHTTTSDGCWPPEQLVAEVRVHAIGLFAVTDHDSIDNVGPTEALIRQAGLAFLRGVEVSTWLEEHYVHILAYGFEMGNSTLSELLRENRIKTGQSNREVIHKLIAEGYPIDPDDFEVYEYEPTRGGWKALNFLIDRGFCTGVRDYFDNLEIGISAIFRTFPHPAEAIAAIRGAGGVPVLAHPGATWRDNGGIDEEVLSTLLDAAIGGVECYHRYNDEATTCFCLDWCARHDLVVTVGSDCHGGLVDRELGFPPVDTANLRLGELEDRIIR